MFVSRQTISGWKNDKSYPDVQSLALISGIFGASIDELVSAGRSSVTSRTSSAARRSQSSSR